MLGAAPFGYIMGDVARRAVGFIRAFALLIDDDEPDIRKRREYRAPRSDNDIRIAALYAFVFVETLTER